MRIILATFEERGRGHVKYPTLVIHDHETVMGTFSQVLVSWTEQEVESEVLELKT